MSRTVVHFLLASVIFFGGMAFRHFAGDAISADDVRAAAKIIGLEFTQKESDSLLSNLEQYREDYRTNRENLPANERAPALVFDPRPPDFQMPAAEAGARSVFRRRQGVRMPEDRAALAYFSIGELAELLRTRQISSVELTTFFLERLKRYDSQLWCVITLTEELALEQARRADAEIAAGRYRGPLHGIPYGAKDLLAVKGYRTTWGAAPYKEQILDYNAAAVEKLEAAGAVLAAKLTLGALAWGDVWYGGMTRNPWDTISGSSGSSAGSAAAVAAGLLPFAIGTETLGSIVSPSTVCGVTGLRPSFGRVSRRGAMALVWSMDKIGPMARSAEDCALVFEAIHGVDVGDPSTIEAPYRYDAGFDPRTLKVGYLKSAFERDYPFKKQDSLTLETLRALGITLIPIELPALPRLGAILSAEAAAAFDELTLSDRDDLLTRQTRNAWPNVFRAARFIPAVEYVQANRLRAKLIADMDAVFQQIDVYVHPSWASPSLTITNYTGHPCVVIPNGFNEGKPTSVTFTGKLFDEGRLLRLADEYQQTSDWHRRHPPAFH
jgi:Asp-tRNA(Asn)/Glu-tRNA(Gln) amidotransferase A subunit family amidase